jgi:mRNA-degrading endonuclease toxin of MazEF toxin-antitoxin module
MYSKTAYCLRAWNQLWILAGPWVGRASHLNAGENMSRSAVARRLPLGLAMVVVAVVAACTTKKNGLSRERVAEQIAATPPFHDTVHVTILEDGSAPCKTVRLYPTQEPMRTWGPLERAGLLRLTDTVTATFADPSHCAALLTAAGKTAAARWAHRVRSVFFGGKEGYWDAPLARRTVAQVTGVATPADGATQSEATFVWRWVYVHDANTSPMGLFPVDSGVGRAMLRKYDDGWRAVGVSLDNGGTSSGAPGFFQ